MAHIYIAARLLFHHGSNIYKYLFMSEIAGLLNPSDYTLSPFELLNFRKREKRIARESNYVLGDSCVSLAALAHNNNSFKILRPYCDYSF